MQAYISLVKWLLSHYKGWNSISCNKMDSLIHTRSLMLKRSLKGVTERNPSRYPFPWSQSWELRAAPLVPKIGTDKEQRVLRNGTQWKKMQHTASLKVERPLRFLPFYFFIIGGDCRCFCEKVTDQLSLFSLNNFSWKASVYYKYNHQGNYQHYSSRSNTTCNSLKPSSRI